MQVSPNRLKQARALLLERGAIPEDLLRDAIARSWRRCLDGGLAPRSHAALKVEASTDLNLMRERHRQLLVHAQPVMENLYEQIRNTHSTVILTDPAGLILTSIGDSDFLDRARRVALQPGVSWDEASRGTNAIGTALAERRPVLVFGSEHYMDCNGFLACSAAPVVNPQGQVIGVLDVSGDYRSHHPHTLGLVRMSAQLIENYQFRGELGGGMRVRFHSRPEVVGTLSEGIAVFGADGTLLSANRSALQQLGLDWQDLGRLAFEGLFRCRFGEVLDRATQDGEQCYLRLRNGQALFARVEGRRPQPGLTITAGEGAARPARAPAARRNGLQALDLGDPQVAAAIAKVRRVLGRGIPILVTGETGTGKELFAQAVHEDSPRHAGPFVAVNCAAIPEGLIESELFGYEEGAFTGARRKGAQGKILQADGGTLFLDEIGDMPLALQARLLRVLQERSVMPLGSMRSHPVDFQLVCATHRNLREMIGRGQFREDLYYRINGLQVSLPPLRERTDMEELVRRLAAQECESCGEVRLAPEVMELFRRHPWPGNVRQLSNLIRTAVAMLDGDASIGCEHLPEDFLDELRAEPEPVADRLPAPRLAPERASSLEEMELAAIRQALEECDGNVSAAARRLGISRNTLYRKLRRS